jgi:lipopolysaccharide biosynthesis regulator YciM
MELAKADGEMNQRKATLKLKHAEKAYEFFLKLTSEESPMFLLESTQTLRELLRAMKESEKAIKAILEAENRLPGDFALKMRHLLCELLKDLLKSNKNMKIRDKFVRDIFNLALVKIF